MISAEIIHRIELKEIMVLEVPLNIQADTIFKHCTNDEDLNILMDMLVEKITDEGLEIFERRENVVVTERCYYCAFYKEDMGIKGVTRA